MPDIIRLLPDFLANQIAAGEVVQRPASVVKELLENAIDAKATNVQLIVKEAGKQLLQVVDNGVGMSETDARMCFERHATSKISTTDDLFRIRTMGFRGEAMASIGAVAQVELKTKPKGVDTGTKLVVEGSAIVLQEPVVTPEGTSVAVKNLFYNVPARRNFLKSNAVEMRHILEEFQRVALAYPEVSFSLHHNDMEVFNLPAGKLSQRIVSIFGSNYKEQMAYCEEDTTFLVVRGYVGKPEFAKKTRGEQFFFVNNRFVKSGYLNHAVMTAFEGLLPKENHPFYVLFIELEPEKIDINVHPTKTEIKFEDEKTVYAIVHAAVKKALGAYNIAPSLDFEQDVNFAPLQPIRVQGNYNNEFDPDSKPRSSGGSNSFPGFTPPVSSRRATSKGWEQLYEPLREQPKPENGTTTSASSGMGLLDDAFAASDIPAASSNKAIQIHQKYLLVQVKSGVMIIDQQAAQERILYEKYVASLQKKAGASQALLFPQTLQLSPTDAVLVHELAAEFKDMGFLFEDFGGNTIILNAIPADVHAANEKELLEELIEQYKNNSTTLKLDKRENLARAMAKRLASRSLARMSDLEMNSLVDKLFACQVPNYTPGGQKTLVIMELSQLHELFLKG
ncbi:DNA mismatch repair protein MutL [Pontibacter ummariensis]|uniref:DNA mismatch repair protein MutL n=1 Tax=Pontibacter ummariensis TaxID=1610492 RepID=A0A239G9G3_9BACT|nr:DNA mismatch repair endonuclease MutL [Pontibacter ummariensis]PRY11578.1 DNA mismatch repair protein MutL [Pontibacter ummariensis]SNS65750.1 DNA mismatch repair protein MutL [Pontibacter ummariensis]